MKLELIKNWEAFKKFRQEKYAENIISPAYLEAQSKVEKALETLPRGFDMFSFIGWDMHDMIMSIALHDRKMAANNGIPPETFEGMLDWLSEQSK